MKKIKKKELTLHVSKADQDYYTITVSDPLGDKVDSTVSQKEGLEKAIEDAKKHWEGHGYKVKVVKAET